MSDNVIKFQRPKAPKQQPRQLPSWLKRLITIIVIAAALGAVWFYFTVTGSGTRV